MGTNQGQDGVGASDKHMRDGLWGPGSTLVPLLTNVPIIGGWLEGVALWLDVGFSTSSSSISFGQSNCFYRWSYKHDVS